MTLSLSKPAKGETLEKVSISSSKITTKSSQLEGYTHFLKEKEFRLNRPQTNKKPTQKISQFDVPAPENPGNVPGSPSTPELPTNPAPGTNPPTPDAPTTPTEQPDGTTPQLPNNQTPDAPTTPTEQPDGTTPGTPSPDTSTPSPSEPRVLVGEVLVDGADEELRNLVYETIGTRPGRTTTRSQLQEDVNAVYATGFFSNVQVTPEDTALGVRITFAVQPNPILNKVALETIPEGQKSVLPPEIIDNTFKEQYGQILNLRDLQVGIKNLNKWYSDNGYDLAQVVGSPKVAEDGTVTLNVAEGVIENIQPRFFNEDQELIKNDKGENKGKTREFIITREVEQKPGNVFNRKTAQRDLQRVFGLGIFEDAKLTFSPGKDPSKVVVNIDVVESSTGSLGAGAGFSSSSGLFGTVSYQQKNLGGNNQTLGAEVQVGTEQQELLFDVNFTDPWIANDPYRTSYTVNGFRRRSISLVFDGDGDDVETADGEDSPRVVRTGGGINFSRPLAKDVFSKEDWRLTAGFQYERVQLENDDGDISPRSTRNTKLAFSDSGEDDLFVFKLGATRDRRNSQLQPTSGSLLRFGVDQSVPIGSGSILLNRLRSSYSYYVPVKLVNFTPGPQALAFNFQAGTILGDLPPYEAFVVGGSNSVRGYSEGKVGSGRSYFIATAEYRFPIFSVVGGAIFADFGTTLGSGSGVPGNPSEIRDLPGSGFGYGAGVRIQSPLGPIRIDYGMNDEGDNRIHFGIGERF
ncbi:MAG: BamA/TamA family outer membrane protein [Xenococcaceae cyanobacterium]